jgi:hypothetical protein
MKKISVVTLLLLLVVGLSQIQAKPTEASPARKVIDNMLNAIIKNKGSVYTMKGTERIKGKAAPNVTEIFTKINVSPHKIYGKILSELNRGTELLYAKGERGDKVRVNPGKYLPSLNLPHTSSLLTKDQHHTILTSGFMIVHKLMNEGIKRADAQGGFDKVFKLEGEVTYNGKKCYKVVIDDPTYAYVNATGLAGEDLYTFARRLLIPESAIMDLNGLKHFDDNVAGKTLKVPTSYAKRTVLYIDEQINFPIYQEMSDEKGVFEKYEYSNLNVNPVFKADEFSEAFSEYKF